MDAATTTPPPRGFATFLAGLQCGMLGSICMLGCLGVAAEWQQRSFWTAENLMASAFYGSRAIHTGFASETVSGLAAYLSMYSLLGALFAAAVGLRVPRLRIVLLAMAFGLGWYWVSFR